jgi:hypothetical protein
VAVRELRLVSRPLKAAIAELEREIEPANTVAAQPLTDAKVELWISGFSSK